MSCYIPFEFHFYFSNIFFIFKKSKQTNKHEKLFLVDYFRYYNVSLLVGFDKITETHFSFKTRNVSRRIDENSVWQLMKSTGFTTNLNLWPYRRTYLSSVSTYLYEQLWLLLVVRTNVGVEQGRVIWTWPQGSATWLDLLGMKKNEMEKKKKGMPPEAITPFLHQHTWGPRPIFKKIFFSFFLYSKTLSPPPSIATREEGKKCVCLIAALSMFSPILQPFILLLLSSLFLLLNYRRAAGARRESRNDSVSATFFLSFFFSQQLTRRWLQSLPLLIIIYILCL